ncbi:MAG: PD40 domain-containing protein [Thaumarchaeota archaeon]|nr:PD40 domain-containing protein [Nitrososphaerota archaeon]
MKTLHLAIIAGTGILTIIGSFVLLHANPFQPEGFAVEKTQKLVDYRAILQIHLPGNQGSGNGITTNDFDWSKDGKFAAFSMGAGAPISYLYTISLDGNEIREIKIPIEFNYIENIHVSPDNTSIYFVGQYNDKKETYQDIFRYDLSNATYRFITKDSHVRGFDLESDGNIVFVESHYNSTRLEQERPAFLVRHYNLMWLASADGKKIRLLYNGTALFQDMVASPDGTKIAFVSYDDPLHPTSNGTDIVDLSLGGGFKQPVSYLGLFDIAGKNFTILEKNANDGYANPRWVSNDSLLYQTMIHQCVQDEKVGENSCPAGLLSMVRPSDGTVKLLYGNTAAPYTAPLFGYAPSSDTRSIIFGMNFDFSNNDIDGTGIYKMDFNRPLRDFG